MCPPERCYPPARLHNAINRKKLLRYENVYSLEDQQSRFGLVSPARTSEHVNVAEEWFKPLKRLRVIQVDRWLRIPPCTRQERERERRLRWWRGVVHSEIILLHVKSAGYIWVDYAVGHMESKHSKTFLSALQCYLVFILISSLLQRNINIFQKHSLHFRITYQPSNLFVLIQIQTQITRYSAALQVGHCTKKSVPFY